MHAYRRFVQEQMDRRSWRQADLVRESGLSPQVVSRMLVDSRDSISQMPDDATVEGLARAFAVDRSVVLAAIGEAMGIPSTVVRADLDDVSLDDLMGELRRRAQGEQGDRNVGNAPKKQSGERRPRGTATTRVKAAPVVSELDERNAADRRRLEDGLG